MEHSSQERMREIEIFGIPALPDSPRHLTADAGEKFLGTVLSPVKIHLTADGQREIEPGDLFLDIEAGSYTPAEFEEKYLSPDYDPQAERYGKAD